MQNKLPFYSSQIFKNKYFLILCFYLKTNYNKSSIYSILFLGYKYKYLLLKITLFVKSFHKILRLLTLILKYNGTILMLFTNKQIINYLLKENCKKLKLEYLENYSPRQMRIRTYLRKLPDLVISYDYSANAIFLNKIAKFNLPIICFNNRLNKNILFKKFYYLILKKSSIYINIILLHIIYEHIYNNKKLLNTSIN